MITDQEEIRFPMKTPEFEYWRNRLLAAANAQDWECQKCSNREALSRLPERAFKCGGEVIVCLKCGSEQTR